MRVVAIVQARLHSTRLPGKVLHPIGGKPMVIRVLDRAKAIPGIDVVVASIPLGDVGLGRAILSADHNVHFSPHEETDVLSRFYDAATCYQADQIVRLTGDCPLLDPSVAGRVLAVHLTGHYPYTSNVYPDRAWPDGLDVEVMTGQALLDAHEHATDPDDREHVTSWMQRNLARIGRLECPDGSLGWHRWTVDTEEDLEFVREVYRLAVLTDGGTGWAAVWYKSILELLKHPEHLCTACRAGCPHLTRGETIIWDLHQFPVVGGRAFGPCEAWAIKKRYFPDRVEAW